MASRKKSNRKPGKAGKIALRVFAALLLALLLIASGGALNADVIRIIPAEVVIPDLPAGFEGVKLLYASDIDLCGLNSPTKSGTLIRQLQALNPDALILGGDYTSPSLLELLNRPEDSDDFSKQIEARTDFFHYISEFEAPLGKFAIAAPEDPDREELRQVLEACDIQPLFNQRAELRSGSDTLWLVGVCEENSNLNAAGSSFSKGECVIAAAYSPSVLPILLTSEARDGGRWADIILCGHTHGGQIRLFGRSVLPLNAREQRFLSGWSTDSGQPILVSQGVGCEGLNIRLGSWPEVWLITLRRE